MIKLSIDAAQDIMMCLSVTITYGTEDLNNAEDNEAMFTVFKRIKEAVLASETDTIEFELNENEQKWYDTAASYGISYYTVLDEDNSNIKEILSTITDTSARFSIEGYLGEFASESYDESQEP